MQVNLDYDKIAKLIVAELHRHPVSWAWLSPGQLASYIDISERTLEEWRRKGIGPRFVRIGKHVRYKLADVDAYLDQEQKAQGMIS